MNKGTLGKTRSEHVELLENIVSIFKANNLDSGIHGTSLWNENYKDLHLLVFTKDSHGLENFKNSLESIKSRYKVNLGEMRGDDNIGLDLDIDINDGGLTLHLSYVIIL